MEGLNDTAETLLASIERDEAEVSPSTLYAAASILEGVPYVNGAPQNTFVPGLIDLAIKHNVLIGARRCALRQSVPVSYLQPGRPRQKSAASYCTCSPLPASPVILMPHAPLLSALQRLPSGHCFHRHATACLCKYTMLVVFSVQKR